MAAITKPKRHRTIAMRNITNAHISALSSAIDLMGTQFEGINNEDLEAYFNEQLQHLYSLKTLLEIEQELQLKRKIKRKAISILNKTL